jgi:hypothetical protein
VQVAVGAPATAKKTQDQRLVHVIRIENERLGLNRQHFEYRGLHARQQRLNLACFIMYVISVELGLQCANWQAQNHGEQQGIELGHVCFPFMDTGELAFGMNYHMKVSWLAVNTFTEQGFRLGIEQTM